MKPENSWMHTYTGENIYPYDLTPEQVNIVDIAHALSRICRFGGHCEGFYSVAQHSVLISELVDKKYKLCALLHDSPEAYVCDIPKPVKMHLEGYNKLEDQIWKTISSKFSLPEKIPSEIKDQDRAIVQVELRDIMGCDPSDGMLEIDHPIPPVEISGKKSDEAKMEFLERFAELKE